MAIYKLDGLSCGHCVKTVEGLLQEKGMTGSVSLEEKKLILEKELNEADFSHFAKELEEEGFSLAPY